MYDAIKAKANAVMRSRSDFQLDKFVIGQHATEPMRYYQTLLELSSMIHDYEIREIDIEIQTLEIQAREFMTDEISLLQTKKMQLILNRNRDSQKQFKDEIDSLVSRLEDFEKEYTREEIEADQANYWQQRLTNNAKAMLMGGEAVGHAYIESMQQAGILESFVAELEEQREMKKELGL